MILYYILREIAKACYYHKSIFKTDLGKGLRLYCSTPPRFEKEYFPCTP